MANEFDPENWTDEAREKWGIDKGFVSPTLKKTLLEKKCFLRQQRQLARRVARAIFNSQHHGAKKAITEAAKLLNEEMGVTTWTYRKVRRFSKMRTCIEYFNDLERQANKKALHTKEKLIEHLATTAYCDRTQIFQDGTFALKPFEEWPEEAKMLLDGVDWKIPKGSSPIPVVKLTGRMEAYEKLGKELGLFKETIELHHPNTEAIMKALGVVVEDVWNDDDKDGNG